MPWEKDDEIGLVTASVFRQTDSDKAQGGSYIPECNQKCVMTHQILGRRRTVTGWRRTKGCPSPGFRTWEWWHITLIPTLGRPRQA